MHQEYADDGHWIEALRQAVRNVEDFQEGNRLKDNNFQWSNSSAKRNREEPTTTKTTKKPKCSTKEKRVYPARQEYDQLDNGKPAPW